MRAIIFITINVYFFLLYVIILRLNKLYNYKLTRYIYVYKKRV